MKNIVDMKYSFPDAENYKRREFKDIFNKTFMKDDYIDDLLKPEISFLMGEKGTGKTAYAVYLSNNDYNGHRSELVFIRETEYQKFVSMKQQRHLDLSDYTNIWKVIILLILSKQILKNEDSLLPKFIKFSQLNKAIDSFYNNAFSPEVINAMTFVQEAKDAAEIMSKHIKINSEEKENITFIESRFQTNLLFLQKNFEKCLSDLKLTHTHTLFIDGIDIRPEGIDYKEYLDCVKGLGNAVWQLNNDFFPSVKDSKGRMRVIILVRPDIFTSIGLQNQNNKVRSNSVLLDWRTEYSNYRNSAIFKMASKLLHSQQEDDVKEKYTPEQVWDHYFPYNTPTSGNYNDSSFIGFLRNSFYRPRDIITMLSILRQNCVNKNEISKTQHSWEEFNSSDFRRELSIYLLGEIRDQISFYYTENDYEIFLNFFNFLNGKTKFTYDEYSVSFINFYEHVSSQNDEIPSFMVKKEVFLQFLYELNIINFVEDFDDHNPMFHWCFRDRNISNISPKVKLGVRYEIFYGLTKAVNTGKIRKI